MNMREWLAESNRRRRESAGLPVLTCPACGKTQAHWVPESLEDGGGFFECQPLPDQVEDSPLFDLGGDS